MLVLHRRIDEEILVRVGDVDIKVKLTEASSTGAKIGFDAPPEVEIVRCELIQESIGSS